MGVFGRFRIAPCICEDYASDSNAIRFHESWNVTKQHRIKTAGTRLKFCGDSGRARGWGSDYALSIIISECAVIEDGDAIEGASSSFAFLDLV